MAQKYVAPRSFLFEESDSECSSDDEFDPLQYLSEQSQGQDANESEETVDPFKNAVETFIQKCETHEEINPSKIKHCATCNEKIRVEHPSEISVGQHIAMPGDYLSWYDKKSKKQRHVYEHHLIVKEIKSASESKAELNVIHFTKEKGDYKICESKKSFDLKIDEMYIVKYKYPCHSPAEIVRRAQSRISEIKAGGERSKYNVLSNNCEHFAVWCAVGKEESSQVLSFVEMITDNSVGKYLARQLQQAPAKIVSLFSRAFPTILFGVASVLHLLDCIFSTLMDNSMYEDGKMCMHCLKTRRMSRWLDFGLFASVSTASFVIVTFALPLLGSCVILPLGVIITLVGVFAQPVIKNMARDLMSPLSFDKNKVKHMSEIQIGDIISTKYYGLEHAMIVTNGPENGSSTTGTVWCVHYGIPTGPFLTKLFRTKQIMEKEFSIDLSKQTVERYTLTDCHHLLICSPNETVQRARLRVGETKWSLENRTDHMCYWAKFKYLPTDVTSSVERVTNTTEVSPSSKFKSTFFIEEKEVHLRMEISVGDVVIHENRLGIVVSLPDNVSSLRGREFPMKFVTTEGRKVILETRNVVLNKERVFVRRYHPARCHSMEIRAKNAEKTVGKRFHRERLIEHCIMLAEVKKRRLSAWDVACMISFILFD